MHPRSVLSRLPPACRCVPFASTIPTRSMPPSRTSRSCCTAPARSPRPARRCVEACLRAGTHYLDITGEIDVFVALHAEHERARGGRRAALPRRRLRRRADRLRRRMLQRGAARRHAPRARLRRPRCAERGHRGDFARGDRPRLSRVRDAAAILDVPLGAGAAWPISGAGRSRPRDTVGRRLYGVLRTGIPNIEIYVPARARSARTILAMQPLARLLSGPAVSAACIACCARSPPGPRRRSAGGRRPTSGARFATPPASCAAPSCAPETATR